MNPMNNFENKYNWANSWKKHIEDYIVAPPRTGIFIHTFLGAKFNSVLEIASGSGRDSRYLSHCGFDATASDYCDEIVNYINDMRFPNETLKYFVEDARKLSFDNNSFDLIFHNGLFIYFNENEKIFEILKEQERVSKKYIVFFVHNSLNKKLVKNFATLSKKDKLYDIRFFSPREVKSIILESGICIKSLSLKKFGGICDILYSNKINKYNNTVKKTTHFVIPYLYQVQNWFITERVACIIELNK